MIGTVQYAHCVTGLGQTDRMVSYFVSADWSKSPDKRSVYVADCCARRIRRIESCGVSREVDALLELAKRLSRDGPVLLGFLRPVNLRDGAL